MCVECFRWQFDEEPLHPAEVTPEVRSVAAMVKGHYAVPGNEVGGRFHIHLDDWNTDFAMAMRDDFTDAELALAQCWNALDERQRTIALGLAKYPQMVPS